MFVVDVFHSDSSLFVFARDALLRIGQTKSVKIYRYVVGCDVLMYKLPDGGTNV